MMHARIYLRVKDGSKGVRRDYRPVCNFTASQNSMHISMFIDESINLSVGSS